MVRRLNWQCKEYPLVAIAAAVEAHPDQRVAPMRLRKDLPADLEEAVVLPVPVAPMLPVDARAVAQAVVAQAVARAVAAADCSAALAG
jgi:hypothetical protein